MLVRAKTWKGKTSSHKTYLRSFNINCVPTVAEMNYDAFSAATDKWFSFMTGWLDDKEQVVYVERT